MEKQVKSQWEKKLQKLWEDSAYAVRFTEILLEKFLKGKAEVKELSVRLPRHRACRGELVILDAAVKQRNIVRNMEIILCREMLKEEPTVSFLMDYYCVEAPAILVDSGNTTLRLSMGKKIEKCLQEAEA